LELSTITRIEQYLCDALIASPVIPINVNVLRLADAVDKEGVVQQTNNIVVRYTGSSNTVVNKIPMVFTRRMSFELNFSCQNYLSSSGHDFATQLLTGAFQTLNGGVPGGAGVQSIEPFSCDDERFTGITENSQYTYTQTYSLVIEEALPYIALDPCVQRGDCRSIWPGLGVETKMPLGGVLDEASGEIYVPAYICDGEPPEDFNRCEGVRWSNEIGQNGNWVFICDPDCVFLEDPLGQPIYLLSTNSYTADGRLVVTIWNANTREPIREVFYCSTGKKLARYAIELWKNTITDEGGISPKAKSDANWFQSINYGEFAVVTGGYQFLYSDPMSPDSTQVSIDGGELVGVMTDTFIQTPKGRFYYIGQSPKGRGWMLEGSFQMAEVTELWRLGCLPCTGNSSPISPC
jgi:hypothetical protein